jgi:predicted  nucleic acid-binding Zn-ribbon protein
MTQDLENLVRLQEIDLRIKEQELAKDKHPAAVADLEQRIAQAEKARDAAAAKLAQLTGNVKDLGDQEARLREGLARSQDRLNSIQTNREYDAVHGEIEAQKGMLGASENKKKTLEADIDKQKAAFEEAEKEAGRVKSELQPQIDDLNAKIGAIDSNIAEIAKERDRISPQVSQYTKRIYDSIRKKRKNGKVVSIVNEAKTCTVCFMVLRPQLYSEVRRGSNFTLCENCGSILVWGGEGSALSA